MDKEGTFWSPRGRMVQRPVCRYITNGDRQVCVLLTVRTSCLRKR